MCQQRRGQRRKASPLQSGVEAGCVFADRFDVVHDRFPVMAGFIPAIHVFAALDQALDTRVKPGHDESQTAARNDREKAESTRPIPLDWPSVAQAWWSWPRRPAFLLCVPPKSSLRRA